MADDVMKPLVRLYERPVKGMDAFLWDSPWIGGMAKEKRAMNKRLMTRSLQSFEMAWEGTGLLDAAQKVAVIIQETLGRPNYYFYPDDPLELLLIFSWDGLEVDELVLDVERAFGIECDPNASESLCPFYQYTEQPTFGDLIRWIVAEMEKKRVREKAHAETWRHGEGEAGGSEEEESE